jgi:hypothetical protein
MPGAPAASAMPGLPGNATAIPKASGQPGVPGVLPSVAGQPTVVPQASVVPAVGQPSAAPNAPAAASPSQAPAQLAGSGSTLLPAVVSAASGSPNSNPTIGGTIPQTLPALGAPGLPVNAPPIPLMGGGLGPWGFFGPWGGVNNAPLKGPWKRSSPKMMRRQDVPASTSDLPPLPTVVGASSVPAAAASSAPAAADATTFPAVAASEISAGAREPTPGVSAANSMATIAPPVASAPAASVPSAGAIPAASASAGAVPAAPPVVPQPIASEAPKSNTTLSASASAKASLSGAQPPIVPVKTSSGAPAASASPAIPPPGSVKEVTVQFPINKAVLLKILGKLPDTPNNGNGNGQLGESASDITDDMLRSIQFQVARRDVGADNQRFTPFSANAGNANAGGATSGMKLTINNGNLQFSGGTQLDGEYVVLIPAQATTQALAQAQKKNAATSKGVESGHLVALAIVIFAALMV